MVCKFKWAGCQWKAKASEVENHLNNDCAYRQKTAVDLVTHCKESGDKRLDIINLIWHYHHPFVQGELAKSKIARMEKRNILDMLSSQDIGYKDVKLSAFRTDNYQSKLQFESEEFQLLGSAWQLKGNHWIRKRECDLPWKEKVCGTLNFGANSDLSDSGVQIYHFILDTWSIQFFLRSLPFSSINIWTEKRNGEFTSEFIYFRENHMCRKSSLSSHQRIGPIHSFGAETARCRVRWTKGDRVPNNEIARCKWNNFYNLNKTIEVIRFVNEFNH